MLDTFNLFISKAFAADGAAPALEAATNAVAVTPPDAQSTLMKFMPLFLIFMVFYFLLIRPQQKKLEEQNNLIKALKKGDKVITNAGIYGVVSKLEGEESLLLEISKGVEIKVLRTSVSR
ncbi:MAG TPA: preprotein translocase subunit YajC, partial [Rhodospirillaceae bacterium]|nr:preprotein translocase subunit YajC [Rhodospirillaceae bacterium]